MHRHTARLASGRSQITWVRAAVMCAWQLWWLLKLENCCWLSGPRGSAFELLRWWWLRVHWRRCLWWRCDTWRFFCVYCDGGVRISYLHITRVLRCFQRLGVCKGFSYIIWCWTSSVVLGRDILPVNVVSIAPSILWLQVRVCLPRPVQVTDVFKGILWGPTNSSCQLIWHKLHNNPSISSQMWV